jgi:hypothetical protein
MDLVDEMLPLGEVCASTCWVAVFCMEHNLLVSLYPEVVQDEIFGKQPYVMAPGCAMPPGRAEPVEGGYRVSGRWRYATGVMHADWAMGLAVDTTNRKNARWFLFPLADATVFDVWHMDGMSATGSNDFAVDDVFVPAERSLDFIEMSTGTTPERRCLNPMYHAFRSRRSSPSRRRSPSSARPKELSVASVRTSRHESASECHRPTVPRC